MNDYLLKLQAIGELREIAKVAKANREAAEIVLSTLEWLNRYCDKNGITPPDESLIIDQMKKLQALLAPDESYHRKQTDKNLPESRSALYIPFIY